MSQLQHVAGCKGHLHIILCVRSFFSYLLYLLSCITLLGSMMYVIINIMLNKNSNTIKHGSGKKT